MSMVTQATPAATKTARPPQRKRTQLNPKSVLWLFLARVGFLGLLLGGWQLIATYELVDPSVSSSPGAVMAWLAEALTGSKLWINLQATLTASLMAWVLASVVGTFIGIALALLPRVEKVVNPYLSAFNAMPRIALAPLFVVAFGLTINSKIALAFSIVVFMAINAARTGVASLDIDHTRLAEVLGASKVERFFKILLPVAVPSIFGGLRLGLIYALLGTLTAELIGSVDGIGQQLQEAAGLFQTDAIYGLLIVLAITATLINAGMSGIERKILRWQP
ncbi:ABC transporter permease [Arthrobacter sp. GCM10027362]|uniref:ABC transporter permease n=1 Tax=Arthrobacter sp. GCM10027362 TaxID=3273379 RepID=UPI003643FB9A